MRKIYLFCLFIGCFFKIEAQSWVYHEFPDSNAIWNISYEEYGMGFCGEYSYTISDDTLINNTVYHKIMKTGHDFSMTYYTNPTYHWVCDHSVVYGNYTTYAAAIREDVLHKKVYIIAPSDTTLQLLYDFNLNVGDSLKGYLSLCNNCSKVTSVDSILINTTYCKRWKFQFASEPNAYSIIEGIGSSFGLLNPYTDFEYMSNLDCFSQNGHTLYPFYSASAACALLTSTGENFKTQPAFTIFPNPSNGLFQLAANMDFTSAEVTNLLGTTIKKFEIKNGAFELDLSNESQGIYFVRISDIHGNSVVKKVVKQ